MTALNVRNMLEEGQTLPTLEELIGGAEFKIHDREICQWQRGYKSMTRVITLCENPIRNGRVYFFDDGKLRSLEVDYFTNCDREPSHPLSFTIITRMSANLVAA